VLVADDDPENRVLLERILHNGGYSAYCVRNGAEAVAAFRSLAPCFIWMELSMPVMTGVEAAHHIRELEGGSGVKIAAVTSSTKPSQRLEVLCSGFDDLVRKPYRARAILDCMAKHLGLTPFGAVRCDQGAQSGSGAEQLDLTALPPRLRADLGSAVMALDPKRIETAIRSIALVHPDLADALSALASRYAYSVIDNAIKSSNTIDPPEPGYGKA
jgi:CheY-like chemotaxis protein